MRGLNPRMTSLRRNRVPRHQIVGMLPARQRLDALALGGDRRMLLGYVEAELFGRVVEVAGKRHVRDGRPVAEQEFAAFEPLVDDGEIAVDASLEEGEHGWVAGGLREVLQKPVWPEETIDLLIVEDDPAQRFELLFFALRQIFSSAARQISEDHARLGELLLAVHEHRRFAHFVDLTAILRRTCLPLEEVDIDGLPVRANEIEHQCGAIGVAGLCEAMKLVFGHGDSSIDCQILERECAARAMNDFDATDHRASVTVAPPAVALPSKRPGPASARRASAAPVWSRITSASCSKVHLRLV